MDPQPPELGETNGTGHRLLLQRPDGETSSAWLLGSLLRAWPRGPRSPSPPSRTARRVLPPGKSRPCFLHLLQPSHPPPPESCPKPSLRCPPSPKDPRDRQRKRRLPPQVPRLNCSSDLSALSRLSIMVRLGHDSKAVVLKVRPWDLVAKSSRPPPPQQRLGDSSPPCLRKEQGHRL